MDGRFNICIYNLLGTRSALGEPQLGGTSLVDYHLDDAYNVIVPDRASTERGSERLQRTRFVQTLTEEGETIASKVIIENPTHAQSQPAIRTLGWSI